MLLMGFALTGTPAQAPPLKNAEETEILMNRTPPGKDKIKLLVELVRHYREERPSASVKFGEQALELLSRFPDPHTETRIYNYLSWGYIQKGQLTRALEHGLKAEKNARALGDKKLEAAALSVIGDVYGKSGEFDSALPYLKRALQSFEELDDLTGMGGVHSILGIAYKEIGDLATAQHHLEKSLEILSQQGIDWKIAWAKLNLGALQETQGRYEPALKNFQESLLLMTKINSSFGIASAQGNIADVYNKTGRSAEALKLNALSLAGLEKVGNLRTLAMALNFRGAIYFQMKDLPNALRYNTLAIEKAREQKDENLLRDFTLQAARIHEALNDFPTAYALFQDYKTLSDNILDSEKSKTIALLEVRYGTEKKEKEIELLTKNQRLLWTFLFLVGLLVAIIGAITFSRFKVKRRTEKVLRNSEQQLRLSNAAKDRLFTIIAHDLGNPLNSLLLSSTHLEKHFQILEPDDVRDFIHNIYKQTTEMSALLTNLLEWSVSQLGKMQFSPEDIDLMSLTEESILQVRYAAEKKDIRIRSHVAPGARVTADKHMMRAVLRNLLSNAIKYSHPGGEVSVNAELSELETKISVSDMGVGINAEKLSHLFKNEAPESSRGTADERGTGLGLLMCREFVEKNRGRIQVDSRPNQGSRFSVILPAPPSPP